MLKLNQLRQDLIAGTTVALILVPQSLACAQLAGLPPQFGLYASLLPPFIASFFGSSRYLITGPVAILSLMTAAGLSVYYTPGSSEYISMAILLALSLGIFQLVLGLLRLGGLVSFLSHPVIYGFTNAAAIIIATSQLSKFFNVSSGQFHHQYETIAEVFQKGLTHTDWFTFILGLWALLMMYSLKKLNRKFPAVLATVILGTLFSLLLHYNGPVIGSIPIGLPGFILPELDIARIGHLIPVILAMGLIGFTESISIAQAIAVKTKDRIDPNKELIGLGLSNTIGAFTQSYPVTGSFSMTAVNYQAGVKSRASSIFTFILILFILLFFTNILYSIPKVILAAVIVLSVGGLIDFKKFKYIWYTNPYDGIAALLTFGATLYFAPALEMGVALGVIFSIGHYLYRSVHPRIVFLSKYKDGQLHDVERFKMDRCENIAVLRLDAPLFFANSAFFENEIINDVVENQKIRDVLIVANGINYIDATGEDTLQSLLLILKNGGKKLYFSDLKATVINLLTRSGLLKEVHKDHIFPKSEQAIIYLIRELEHNHNHNDKHSCPLKKFIKDQHAEHVIAQDKRETIAYFYNKLIGAKKNKK